MSRLVRFGLLLSALLAVSACSEDPYAEALKHIANGDAHVKAQKYPEAILEYKIAISLVDISSVAHFHLAEAYVKNDDLRNAYGEYLRAADLELRNDEYQIKAGNMLLLSGRFQEAKNRARIVLERAPDSVPAIVLLGNALVGLKDFESAAELGRKVIELDPQRPGGYRNLGVVELIRGNGSSAEQAFKRAMELDPKSVSPVLSLSDLYRATGELQKAEDALKRALAMDPNHVVANQAMASFYIEQREPQRAEPFLKTAAQQSTDPNDELALADYYMGMERHEDAKTLLNALKQKSPAAIVPANTRLAVITYAQGDRAGGHRLMDEALQAQPNEPLALAMKARLQLSDNQVEEALATAKAAVVANPRSTEAQLMLGRVYLARKEMEDARKAFNEALRLGAVGIEAQIELARLHLERGEIDTAIDFAKQGLQAAPDNLEAQLMLVRSMAAKADDEGKAEAALRPMLGKYPNSPQVSNLYGWLLLKRGDQAGARRAWDYSLRLDPNNVDALSGLIALAADAGRPQDAWGLLDTRIKAAPRNSGLLVLGAKVRMASHDMKAAEQLLKDAIVANPSNMDAYGYLGQLYITQRRTEEAKAQYLEVLKREPRSVAVHAMMALLHRAEGDVDGAIDWYKKALLIDSRAAVPANNLAAIYLSRNTQLDEAQRLAEIARGAQPNQAEFHDTLGWVYYRKGLTAQAIETLYRAVQLNPNNPSSRFHLGMAYVQDGTDPQARQQLQVALALDPSFPQAEEAQAALKKLVY
jgi:tetratricopeptide (TPR) repeat protein